MFLWYALTVIFTFFYFFFYIFSRLDVEDDVQSIHEEVAPQLRGDIAHIVHFNPDMTEGAQVSEYSYNPVVSTFSGKLIDQVIDYCTLFIFKVKP